MKKATLIMNATGMTKVFPIFNIHVPAKLTGNEKLIEGVRHLETKIGKDLYWIDAFYFQTEDEKPIPERKTKTSIVKEFCADNGIPFTEIPVSATEPDDIFGHLIKK